MIKINDLTSRNFVDITKLLGERWFERDPNEDYNSYELVNVTLAEAVIFKAYTNGDVVLNLGGRVATIPNDNYYNIEII